MTKRSPWPMVVPAGTTTVGTARVRESAVPPMTTPQRRIYEKTGVPPQASALDDPLDPFAGPAPQITGSKKPPKYRNTKCEHNGIKFDSLRERSRWFELVQQQARGEISELQLQVEFELTKRNQRDDGTWERASSYVADFTYMRDGKLVVEDVKSDITRKNGKYVQKRKDMLEKYGISIKEVK